MKYSPILRTIALALVVSFSVQEMAHAGSVSSLPSVFTAPKISQLNIPDAFANVRDTFEAKGQRKSPLLIHIQDAHTNTSAQLNLSKTLGYLVREKGIRTIFMEGGTQDDSLTFLRSSADAATRDRVAKQFLMRGELNGAEHLNLSSDLDMRLLGVEDKDLYETNLRLYAEMVVHREDVLSYIEKLESRANELKASFYPKEILDFDAFLSAFEKKEKDFTEYYDRLSAMAEKSGIHTPYFPNFESLKNLKVLEGRIDFNKANEEQAALMAQLSGEDFGEWSEKLEKIRSQNYSAYPFYVELFAKAAAKNISLAAYPNLQRYAEYPKAYSTVDFESLFSETGMLQEAVYRKSLGGSDAYYVYEISDFLSLLKKLFRMQITADEFQKYLNYRRDPQFETVAMLAFMNRAFFDRSKDDGILDYVPAIEQYEKKAGQFYLNNEKRDEAFIEKALFTMRKDGLDAAVLVTGGYHSQGLSRLMRRAGISYAVVTPRLSHETNVERYESVLLSDLGSENPLKKSSLTVSSSVGKPHETMMARSLVERNGGMYLSVVQNYLGHAAGRPPVVTPAGKASFTETALPTQAEKQNFTLAGARLAETRPGYLNRLHEGIGERTPDWHRLSVIASIFLDSQKPVSTGDLINLAHKHLKEENLDADDAKMLQLADKLVALSLLRKENDFYILNVSPRLLAVKTDNAYFILEDLRKLLDKDAIKPALEEYSKISQLWPNYPLESRWPVLRAVALMHAHEQSSLARALRENDGDRDSALFDSILFMLDSSIPSDWFEKHAASLVGRSIYYISPETWLVAGGLGRVGQYHTVNMKRLAGDKAEIITVEPYYPFKLNHKGETEKVDYSKLPTPVEGLSEKPFMEFNVPVAGKVVRAQVFEGTNRYGIKIFLIKDSENYYTRLMYRYGKEFGSSSWEEFTEFFSRSSLELTKRLESEKWETAGESYKAPVIVPNDGQLGFLPLYKRMMDASNDPNDHVLKKAWVWMVTHTYRNRGIFGFTNGPGMAHGAGIRHPWDDYLKRIDTMDVTSAGIRTADGASAVAAVHRDEVSGIDPGVNEIAITNGDNREISSAFFREIMHDLFPGSDPEHPTREQVRDVKIEAKRRVSQDKRLIELNPEIANLNPDQMTVGYYGRLVDEKAGRQRAFTSDNIRKMVEAGVQVLIFGNVQSHTQWMYDELKELEAEVNQKGPGRLIVVTGWSLPEQVKMLAATDIQMQDSDRATGASEYTESDVSANGGLQAGPPWIEGIIGKQGIVVNWDKPDFGNTLIPNGEAPEDYLALILRALNLFNSDRLHFASYQAASIRLSRILEASLTAAEYLRQFNALCYRNDDPAVSLLEFIKANNGAQNYMNNPWLRRRLAEALAASHYAREIKTHNPLLRAFLTDIDGSKRIVVLDTQMRHAVHEEPGLLEMKEFFSGSLINPKTRLTVVDSASGAKYDTYSVEDLLSKGLPIMIRYPGAQVLELDRPIGARLAEQHNDYEVDMGVRYWNGELKTTPITRPFRASRKEDVPMINELTDADALRLERLGDESIARGEGVFSMLIAGASSRMNTHEAPVDVKKLVQGKDLQSKAAVPIGVTEDGSVTTYLGEYGENLSRFLSGVEHEAQKAGKSSRVWNNGVLFLSNDEYRGEHDALLAEHNNYGLRPGQIRFFHQPLGPKFVGTPADVEKLKTKFAKSEDYEAALAYSKEVEAKLKAGERDAVMLAGERDPWGHGEYLHQLVASGELLGIVDAGRKWIAVKNVDNYSSKFDKIFSRILGMFLEQQLDFQPEVSPRSPGQKGGSLIVMEDNNAHQLAEDPNIAASNTSVKPTDSYWFNNAVAIMSPRYVISLYKKDDQSDEDFIAELRAADEAGRQKIADRGRQKFPKIFDAKPAKKTKAVAIKPETNMWQSSGVVPSYIRIRAIGVNGVRNLPIESYLHGMSAAEKEAELAAMRFLSTKMWSKSPKEIEETRAALEAAMGRKVTDNELMVTLETYEGNKILAADVLQYNRKAELVTAGIFSASITMPNGTYTGDQFRLRATSGQHPVDNSAIEIKTTDGRTLNGIYQGIKNNGPESWVELIEPDSSASASISLSSISKVTINPAGARLVMNDAELRKTGLAMIATSKDPYVTQDAVKSLLPDGANIIKFKNENVVSVDNPLMQALRRFFDDNPSWRMKGTPNEDTHAYVSYNDMTFNDAKKRSGRLYFFTRDTSSSTTISFSVGMGAFVYFLGELLSSGKPSEKLLAREWLTEVETEKFNANPTASQTISLDRFAKRADAILTSKADPVVSQGRLARFVKQPYNQTAFVNFRIDAGTLKLVQEAGIHIGVYAKSVSASTKPQPDYRTYVKFGEERYEFATKGAFILFIAQVLEVNPRIARGMVMEAETQISTPLAGARLAEGPAVKLRDLRAAYIQAVVEYRDFLAPYPQGAFSFMGDPVLMARNVELMTILGQKREGYVRAQYLKTPLPLQFGPAIRGTLDSCNLIPAHRMLEERKIAGIISEMEAKAPSGARLSSRRRLKALLDERARIEQGMRMMPKPRVAFGGRHFEVIKGAEVIIPVGDVHGDMKALLTLLGKAGIVVNFPENFAQIEENPSLYLNIGPRDVIVFAGDLIDLHLTYVQLMGMDEKKRIETYGTKTPNLDVLKFVDLLTAYASGQGALVRKVRGNHDEVYERAFKEMLRQIDAGESLTLEKASIIVADVCMTMGVNVAWLPDFKNTLVELLFGEFVPLDQVDDNRPIDKEEIGTALGYFSNLKWVVAVDNHVITHAGFVDMNLDPRIDTPDKLDAALEAFDQSDLGKHWSLDGYAYVPDGSGWMGSEESAREAKATRETVYGVVRKVAELPADQKMHTYVGHSVSPKVERGTPGQSFSDLNDDVIVVDGGMTWYYRSRPDRFHPSILTITPLSIGTNDMEGIAENLAGEDRPEDILAGDHAGVLRQMNARLIEIDKAIDDIENNLFNRIFSYFWAVVDVVYDYSIQRIFVAPAKAVYRIVANYPVITTVILVAAASTLFHVGLKATNQPFSSRSYVEILQINAAIFGSIGVFMVIFHAILFPGESVLVRFFASMTPYFNRAYNWLLQTWVVNAIDTFLMAFYDWFVGPVFVTAPKAFFYDFPKKSPEFAIIAYGSIVSIVINLALYTHPEILSKDIPFVGRYTMNPDVSPFQIIRNNVLIFGAAAAIILAVKTIDNALTRARWRRAFEKNRPRTSSAPSVVSEPRSATPAPVKKVSSQTFNSHEWFYTYTAFITGAVIGAYIILSPLAFQAAALAAISLIASGILVHDYLNPQKPLFNKIEKSESKPALRRVLFNGLTAVRSKILAGNPFGSLTSHEWFYTYTAFITGAVIGAYIILSPLTFQAAALAAISFIASGILVHDYLNPQKPLFGGKEFKLFRFTAIKAAAVNLFRPLNSQEGFWVFTFFTVGVVIAAYFIAPPFIALAVALSAVSLIATALIAHDYLYPSNPLLNPKESANQTVQAPVLVSPTDSSGARLSEGARSSTLALQAPLEVQLAYWKDKSKPRLPISVRRVLIADNVPDFADGIRRLVKKALPDAEIVVVSNGAEALSAYQAAENPSHPFDLIFTDNNMEDPNAGLSFIEHVRDIEDSLGIERTSAEGTIVAIVSGSLQNVDSKQALQSRLGVNTFGIAKNGSKTMVPELRLLIATLTGQSVESLTPQLPKLEEPETIEVRTGTRLSLLEKPAVAVTPAVQDEIRQFGARLTLRDGIRNFVSGKVYPFLTLAGIALITITATPDASAADVSATLDGSPAVISKTTVDPVRVRADLVRERNEKTKETLLKTPTALPETSRDLAEPKESIADVVGSLMLANPALAQFIATWNNGYAKNAWNRLSAALGKSAVGAPPAEHYTITIPYGAIFDRSGDVQSVVDMKETLKALAAVMKAHPVQFTVLFTNQDAPLDATAEARVRASLEAWTEREVAEGRSLSLEFLQVRAEETLVASVRGHIEAENFQNLAKVIVGVDVKSDPGRIGTKDSLKNSTLDSKVEFYGVETPSAAAAQAISAAAIVFTAVRTVMPELVVPAELGIALRKEKTPFGDMYVVHPLNLDRELLRTLLSKQTTSRAA